MIWIVIGVSLIASLFIPTYIHDEIYVPHKQHLKKSKELFDNQKRRCENNFYRNLSNDYWKPSLQKMNSETFISTYPLMKEFLSIYSPIPNADIYCYTFQLLNPKEKRFISLLLTLLITGKFINSAMNLKE